jgi:hypothetical protein
MMKSVALLIALLCLASIAPAATAAELNYSLYLLAVPLADATFTLDQSAAAYRMTMSFHTTGLADLFASDQLAEHITGRIENDRLVPYDYGSSSRLRGQDRLVGLVWRNGTPVATAIVPPNAGEREEVPASLLPNTIDPLSAIVLMLRQVARTGRCDSSARTYDGRRVSLFEAKTIGEEDLPASHRSSFAGRALRCDFSERTLAGARIGSGHDEDAKERPGELWIAPIVPGGPRLPVRATVATRWFGDATVYLTSASP